MSLRQTHTYAVLKVSRLAFDEIARKLREAEYDHAFHDGVIDMHGIALAPEDEPAEVVGAEPDVDCYAGPLAGLVALPDAMQGTLAQFAMRIATALRDEQGKIAPDNALIGLLCDAARLGSEYIALARTARIGRTPERPKIINLLDDPGARADGQKLFGWQHVDALRRYGSGSVFVMARDREEAVRMAVEAARHEDVFDFEDFVGDDREERDRLDEKYRALEAELRAKAPDVSAVPKAWLVKGSE